MKKGGDSDAAGLWQQVASSVKPLKGKKGKKVVKAAPRISPKALREHIDRHDHPIMRPVSPPVLPKKAAALGVAKLGAAKPPGFDKKTEMKLRKGSLPVEGRLDLHDMTQAEAFPALIRFVERAYAAGKRTLLVITGKGRVGEGGGVLRRALPHWLEDSRIAAMVLSAVPATLKDGGAGAFYVRLRKRRD